MNYIELQCKVFPSYPASEMLMAELGELGYESFMENDTGFLAYIEEDKFDFDKVKTLNIIKQDLFDIYFSYKIIPKENWNKKWENNYNPVLINDKCYIRAPFHNKKDDIQYDIIIEPKMSFGTAHHETTSLMINIILSMNLKNKNVLDMGSGTGVLSILTSKMGAKEIVAIDIDQWAYENIIENSNKNNITNIQAIHGGQDKINHQKFDVILANINRNILLEQINIYAQHIVKGGVLILSGFYNNDMEEIENETSKYGFKIEKYKEKNQWVACKFIYE